jgi:hypothetical protein
MGFLSEELPELNRMLSTKELGIMKDHLVTYLNDHMAATIAGSELAKRCRSSNKENPLAEFLEKLILVLESQESLIKELIAALNATESISKKLAAWTAEKLGRFKLNDAILSYSDLSRVVELEGLVVILQGLSSMWQVLQTHCSNHPKFINMNIKEAAEAAANMLESTKQQHLKASERAFCKDLV